VNYLANHILGKKLQVGVVQTHKVKIQWLQLQKSWLIQVISRYAIWVPPAEVLKTKVFWDDVVLNGK
jgi:hypothetical protein